MWVDHLRDRADLPHVRAFRAVRGDGLLVTADLVLLEVLQGAADERHAGRLGALLRAFPVLQAVDEATVALAAGRSRLLRSRGVTVRKSVDLLLSALCLTRGLTPLHNDRDFDAMERHLGLRVLRG